MPAIYIGPIEHLRGETALIRSTGEEPAGVVLAQFDRRGLTHSGKPTADGPLTKCLAYGWHSFPRSDFKVRA